MISLVALAVLLIASSSDAGVSYIRWGRTVCPTGASRLYKGFLGSAHYAVGGNGANYLCAHEAPKFAKTVAGVQAWTAMLYGAEMEYIAEYAAANAPFSNENLNGGQLANQDMVCVVCYVAGSSDHLMVPGRQDCGQVGYDLQYKGYLVAEWHGGRMRGQYVCMDESPEGRPGGSGDNNQGVVYPVQIGCGSIPCTPYVEGFEMPCSVCTY